MRRTRSVQRELKAAFAPERLAQFRAEFTGSSRPTGDARDLDVYVLEFDSMRALVPEECAADLEPLLGVLRSRRRPRAARWSGRCARSARARCGAIGRRSSTGSSAPEDGRPAAAEPIGERSRGARIARSIGGWSRWDARSTTRARRRRYHELRKKGKELRYLLELFGCRCTRPRSSSR